MNLNRSVGSQVGPSSPIVLIEGIFNGNDGEFLDPALVKASKGAGFQVGSRVRFGVLKVQIVLARPAAMKETGVTANPVISTTNFTVTYLWNSEAAMSMPISIFPV